MHTQAKQTAMRRVIRVSLILLHVYVCIGVSKTSAQSAPCQVRAEINPSAPDSIVPLGTVVNLTSQSLNSSSYRWFNNGVQWGIDDAPLSFTIQPGLTRIDLVAYNGVCTDTASVYYFCPGTPPVNGRSVFSRYGVPGHNLETKAVSPTADGGFVIVANSLSSSDFCSRQGLVIKMRDKGCVDWSRFLTDSGNPGCSNVSIDRVYVAKDESIFVIGRSGEVLYKLDNLGKLLWERSWRTLAPNHENLNNRFLTSDVDGNTYLLSNLYRNGILLSKIDKNGSHIWTKYLEPDWGFYGIISNQNQCIASGIEFLNDKLYITFSTVTNNQKTAAFVMQLDASTGQTGWSKNYSNVGLLTFFEQLRAVNSKLVVTHPNQDLMAIELDELGNVQGSHGIQLNNFKGVTILNRVESDVKGNLYFLRVSREDLGGPYLYAFHNYFAKVKPDRTIEWANDYLSGSFNGYFIATAMSTSNVFGSTMFGSGKLIDATDVNANIGFLKIDSLFNWQSDLTCGIPSTATSVSENILAIDARISVDSFVNIEQLMTGQHVSSETYVQSRNICPDYIDSCSFFKLQGPATACNPANLYELNIIRNKTCGQVPKWRLPDGVTLVSQSASRAYFRFPGYGIFTIFASLDGCMTIADSFTIRVEQKYWLNLGEDTFTCNSVPIQLRASPKFTRYLWSDGSSDSILFVSKAGRYWVEVIDSCGNMLRDSIIVENLNYPVELGPDRMKCNNDTLQLIANGDFSSYQWFNNYQISGVTGQSVVVNPQIDTSYYVKATRMAGCFAFDTIHIKVFHSPAIFLGNDTSFCADVTLQLNPGTGFVTYLWNTGDQSPNISVNKTGKYFVKATTAEGCISRDTIQIQVWPLPEANISGPGTLCENKSRILEAGDRGTGSQYLWNTGANTRSISVNQLGHYSVQVTNQYGCVQNDTIDIRRTVPPPYNFLPADTSICSYGKIELGPASLFNSYLWNTGATTRTISISKPGVYSLQVMDANLCIGQDTILVNPKNCITGFYIPTAFTPNHDGRNDVIKPLLFGDIAYYEFTIFNRWGQQVFHSNDPSKGWNGSIGGHMQDVGTYAFTCQFQFEGERRRVERGTFVLIR